MKTYILIALIMIGVKFSVAQSVIGKVTDERGAPLAGATIQSQQAKSGTITDQFGEFILNVNSPDGEVTISYVGYQKVTISYNPDHLHFTFRLKEEDGSLNAVEIIGYGSTTKKLNTGSVSTLNAAEIAQQPVTNVLSSLSGRLPGVYVQTSNGLPGGNVDIQVRGTGSITAGNDPLYIIDGVPFNSTVGTLNSTSVLSASAVNGQISPLNSLNPGDIASISVLKDADATSIYGSRGANGVILITTKKGKAGKTKIDVSVNEGITEGASVPKLFNLEQYLAVRNEAFTNSGVSPSSDPNSANYAPDLTVWGNQNTNWAKYFLGGTGNVNNDQLSISGGNNNTSFVIGTNYHSEKAYLPGNNFYDRGGVYVNLQHTSENGKFYLQFSNSLTLDHNLLSNPAADIGFDILLAPNYPVYDQYGNYNWYSGGNPVAESTASSVTSTDNIISNILLRYTLIKNLNFKISAGYNKITVDQTQISPTTSLYPGSINYTNFGHNSNQTFILEPQLTYDNSFKNSTLNLLAGGTYQNSNAQGETINANDFSSTELMNNISSAAYYYINNNYTEYKYASLFGRATYTLNEKYVFNATVRRDGSSRFGPNEQFGNFGSVGAAWIWSDEQFAKANMPFISYGKLRGSYGLTGNDQIADYQYLSAYGSSYLNYQDIPGLAPSRIANPDFHWETTKKLDFAMNLGFLKNRILLDIDYYQELTGNQLVSYNIPSITGFTSYEANLPAVVKNTGWEIELNTKNITGEHFSWTTTFNLTIPRNMLKSFPGLSSSSYANTLVTGEDITRVYGYKFVGLNQSGAALYQTASGSPSTSPNSQTDAYYTLGQKTPVLYGGFGNTFTLDQWSLDVFGQFANHSSFGNLLYTPGSRGNDYEIVAGRWTSAASRTNIPAASLTDDYNYQYSSANYFNTTYFRIKNIALSYALPKQWLQSAGLAQARVYFQAQNILTFWNSKISVIDPESGPVSSGGSDTLPPSKSFVIGIQTTF